jgi:hypothetical protein
MIVGGLPFKEVWLVDFEFGAAPGDIQEPVCLVAWELGSGRRVRLWRDDIGTTPPYSTGPDSLFVAYFATAEIGCHLAFGWPVPERVLDLYVEFRNHTNGLPTVSGAGLLGALARHGLDGIGGAEKDEMRDLVLRGGPWSVDEQLAVLDYCETDVAALARLLPAMLPKIDLPRALLRGRYMTAVARMEYSGLPIDVPTLRRRGLIQPPPGHGVAYIDWEQQEFGIAAALSGDANMQAAYHSGDPYLAFAKQAGAAPPDATKATHKAVREQFKACVLAVQYGIQEESLAHP